MGDPVDGSTLRLSVMLSASDELQGLTQASELSVCWGWPSIPRDRVLMKSWPVCPHDVRQVDSGDCDGREGLLLIAVASERDSAALFEARVLPGP